jgi:hypothetical protein
MSKRKRNVDSAAPPQPKLREFPNWPFEQVMEVARMLYAVRPFEIKSKAVWFHWNGLIEEAFAFLDQLHKFYEELAGERSLWDAENHRREKEAAEAPKLPDPVPFEKVRRDITGQKRTKFARKNFDKFVRYNRRYFGKRPEQILPILRRTLSLSRLDLTFETLNRQLARWRKTGVPRDLVLHLREMFKDSWKEIKSEESRAKANKRKQWPGKKIDKTLSKTAAQQAKREKTLERLSGELEAMGAPLCSRARSGDETTTR